VPFDKEKPAYGSGIRLGTPAVTSRGFKEEEMRLIAHWIDQTLANKNDEAKLSLINQEVISLTQKLPLYKKGV